MARVAGVLAREAGRQGQFGYLPFLFPAYRQIGIQGPTHHKIRQSSQRKLHSCLSHQLCVPNGNSPGLLVTMWIFFSGCLSDSSTHVFFSGSKKMCELAMPLKRYHGDLIRTRMLFVSIPKVHLSFLEPMNVVPSVILLLREVDFADSLQPNLVLPAVDIVADAAGNASRATFCLQEKKKGFGWIILIKLARAAFVHLQRAVAQNVGALLCLTRQDGIAAITGKFFKESLAVGVFPLSLDRFVLLSDKEIKIAVEDRNSITSQNIFKFFSQQIRHYSSFLQVPECSCFRTSAKSSCISASSGPDLGTGIKPPTTSQRFFIYS